MLLASGLTGLLAEAEARDGAAAAAAGAPMPLRPARFTAEEQYQRAAVQVTALAGVILTLVGLLRLGWLVNFLSHSVISGFTTGASLLIGVSQLKYILGVVPPDLPPTLLAQLGALYRSLGQFQWREFCMGMAFLLVLAGMKHLGAAHRRLSFLKASGPLAAAALSIALMNYCGWDQTNPASPTGRPFVRPVGPIKQGAPGTPALFRIGPYWARTTFKVRRALRWPAAAATAGLPPATLSWWLPLVDWQAQLALATLIALVSFVESISIAKALAKRSGYRVNATQELRALGLANVAGGCARRPVLTACSKKSIQHAGSAQGEWPAAVGASDPTHAFWACRGRLLSVRSHRLLLPLGGEQRLGRQDAAGRRGHGRAADGHAALGHASVRAHEPERAGRDRDLLGGRPL